MPNKSWSDQRERQYKHIKQDLMRRGRGVEAAEAIAARTVNKQRAEQGEAESTAGAAPPNRALVERSYRELYALAKTRRIPGRSTMSKEELAWRLAG